MRMSPEERVHLLLEQGTKEVCDDTSPTFRNADRVPASFDEEKFKRGQAFYRRHIYSMFLGKFLGLVSLLSIPSVLNILAFTQRSSEPMTAYKRYLATVFHMKCWYDEEFKPGSKTWKSLAMVRSMHNAASKKCAANNGVYISQKDMAFTQFGFMGFIVAFPERIGIHGAFDEEFEAFIYVWRTIGHCMGIEEKYNICCDSVEETRAMCSIMIENVFRPFMIDQDPRFYHMADALISGMWAMNPMLDTKSILNYIFMIFNQHPTKQKPIPLWDMNRGEARTIWLLTNYVWLMQFTLWRWFSNFLQYMTFWLMAHFPFLAYYMYGYDNSHVDIFVQESRKSG